MFFNLIYNISSIPSKSGNPNSIFLSILPGRNKAGSKLFNLFVAKITYTLFLFYLNPSN